MEIAATGMLSLSAANTGASASEGGPAFAAVLDELGAGAPPAVAKVATPEPAPAGLRTPASATNMPLLASAAAVQTTSALPAALAHDTPAAEGQALLPDTTEMQPPSPDLVASGQPVPQGAAKPALAEKSIKANGEPNAGETAELVSPAVAAKSGVKMHGELQAAKPATKTPGKASQQVADVLDPSPVPMGQEGGAQEPITAPVASPGSELVELAMREPADEVQAEAATVAATPQDPVWTPIVAPAPSAQEQGSNAETKSPELSLGGRPQSEAASGETAPGMSTAGDEGAATTNEPFARMVSSAAPERLQQQTNAPAPLPTGQAASQAVSQQAQPTLQPLPTAHDAAESHPTMSFRADKVAQEMGLEIARRVSMGGDELVIRLDPAELGRISIRMTMNEHGQLRAVVAADAPGVLEAIRADVPELSRTLEQAGVRTDSQSFRFDRGGGNESGSQWQQRYQQQQAATRSGDSNGLGAAEDPTTYRPMATNGRINMMA